MLPGFTSAGAASSWPPPCAEPTGDNKIMREKNTTRFFIMTTKGSAREEGQLVPISYRHVNLTRNAQTTERSRRAGLLLIKARHGRRPITNIIGRSNVT